MKLFYTTEEVAGHFNISISKLNFYMSEFKLNIKKVGRVRKFTHANLEKLEKIMILIDKEGYTLDGAREKLKLKSNDVANNQDIIDKLKDIRKTLVLLSQSLEA